MQILIENKYFVENCIITSYKMFEEIFKFIGYPYSPYGMARAKLCRFKTVWLLKVLQFLDVKEWFPRIS